MPPEPSLDLAHRLAATGWHVFPLTPHDKRPLANCPRCKDTGAGPAHRIAHCPCLSAGRWCHGVRAATTDPDRVRQWWTRQPAAAVGVAAGPSHLVLIDIDHHGNDLPANLATGLLPGIDLSTEPHAPDGWNDPARYRNGRDTLRLLTRLRGGPRPWPTDPDHEPVTTDTPNGGRHLWYQAPDPDLHQAIGGLAWEVDIKAGWSYGLAPGTTTRKGTYHHQGGDPAHPGAMPDWLAREIARVAGKQRPPTPPESPPRPITGTGPRGYLDTVLRRGAEDLARLTDGRKQALAALAYKTGGYLAWAGLTEADVLDQLITAGTTSGLPHAIAERTARRSLANGRTRPLTPRTT